MLAQADFVSFHNYNDSTILLKQIDTLQKYNRPIFCSEYMARTQNSRFETHLPIFKKLKIGAINWGFVSGKTNTIYAWFKELPKEPRLWHHIFLEPMAKRFQGKKLRLLKNVVWVNKANYLQKIQPISHSELPQQNIFLK